MPTVAPLDLDGHCLLARFIGGVPFFVMADGTVHRLAEDGHRASTAHDGLLSATPAVDGKSLVTGGEDGRVCRVDAGGTVSGNWEERTYNQSGLVTGRASANRLNLAISGGIAGSMMVTVSHGSHSVAVLTSGPSLKGINISMSR